MNYWNRALCSVTRRKGKSLILFTVIFVLGNVIAGAIAIQQSTTNVEKKIKNQLGAIATVDVDFNKLMNESSDGGIEVPKGLSVKEIEQIGSSPYVKTFDYSVSGNLFTKKFKSYEPESTGNATVMTNAGGNSMFSLKGTNLEESLEFKEKKLKLLEGRNFTQEEIDNGKAVALISKKVADANGVNVGDQVVLDSKGLNYSQDGTSEEVYTQDHPVEIIGLYEPVSIEQKTGENGKQNLQQQLMETDKFNVLYLPNKTVTAINQLEFEKGLETMPENFKKADGTALTESESQITPTYILKSPEDVDAFKEENKALIPDFYKLNVSTDQYDQVGGTVKKMSEISGYVVLLAIGASLLIISLVVVLFLRDRKHELGIYLSLGEQRKYVVSQILLELVLVSLIAMCLSLVTGNFLGKTVSESMIASDALSQVQSGSEQGMGGATIMGGASSSLSSGSLSAEAVTEAYEVKFSMSYILTFLIAGIGTIFLSAILPLTYIIRLNPKKIMM